MAGLVDFSRGGLGNELGWGIGGRGDGKVFETEGMGEDGFDVFLDGADFFVEHEVFVAGSVDQAHVGVEAIVIFGMSWSHRETSMLCRKACEACSGERPWFAPPSVAAFASTGAPSSVVLLPSSDPFTGFISARIERPPRYAASFAG